MRSRLTIAHESKVEFSLTLEKMNEIPLLYCALKYHDL